MVFRLETEPVHVVAAARPMVKSLFHPEGIRDGYCINGYQRKNHGAQRKRAVSVARSDAMLLWNVGRLSRLPAWTADSPYCRYDSNIRVFDVYPSFSPTRDEFRTFYWAYPAGSQDLESVEEALQTSGYSKAANGWWESPASLWTLVSGEDKWLTRYSVAVLDYTQGLTTWPTVPTRDPQIDVNLDAARAIFATQPDALKLFEQAVDTFNSRTPVAPTVLPVFVNPGLPIYWPILPSYLVYGGLHPWQQTFLQVLTGQSAEATP